MGKPKHSNDPRGEQKGAQQHAEGQLGPKAFEAKKQEVAYAGADREAPPRAAGDPNGADGGAARHEAVIADPSRADGGHRLMENRLQHDEAEKNSEKNRLQRDIDRHGHEREGFQVAGGRETHPALPQDGPERTIKSGGQGGGNRADEDRGGH